MSQCDCMMHAVLYLTRFEFLHVLVTLKYSDYLCISVWYLWCRLCAAKLIVEFDLVCKVCWVCHIIPKLLKKLA